MTKQNLKDLEKIMEYYNYDEQSRQAIEEMAELTQAINKFWRNLNKKGHNNRDDISHIAEEVADVYVCLKQVESYLDISEEVNDYIDYKIHRQLERIKHKG